MGRNRILYGSLTALVVILGLATRLYANYLPIWSHLYLGDILWALMCFFIIGCIFYKSSTEKVFILALLFTFSIELSQLYQAPWINTIRNTTIGGLILGFGFLWRDLASYTVGISLGVLLDFLIKRK